ncbi:translocation/assembly module TamB domain-containing protein [Kitasatospora sp. NPDC001175]|uniref:hypothetical protein n=1 Tax=Kitasatospora sp. NPDC001175 TaxID=3157103 RepID=UPI003D0469EA
MRRTSVTSSSAIPSRLDRLTATERRLWRAFPHGELVDLRTGDFGADDPAGADGWPAERSVRGEVIAALLLGACPTVAGAVAAVRLAGARISGGLRFDHGQVAPLLLLRGCRFEGPVVFDGAVTESIDLSGSRLTTLSAAGAQVRGTLDLSDTRITGTGAGESEGEEDARTVRADGIRVEGGLLAEKAKVEGSFSLINAQIDGRVNLIDAELVGRGAGGESLNAGGMRVGRSLMAQRLRTEGALRIPGAHIGSSLYLTGARLDGRGHSALHGDSLTVVSYSFFSPHETGAGKQPFTAIGTVRLPGANFGSGLTFSGAQLTPTPGGPALRANRMQVAGSLHLGKGFHTDGEIRLTGARVTGHLDLEGMDSPRALLTLYAASAAGGISDTAESWPGRLNLDGFAYGPFSRYADAADRLNVIRRQVRRSDPARTGGFRAQPYEQLAAYYRSLGNDGEARTVLLARQRAVRAELSFPRRLPGYLLDLLVGYGYRPLRAFGWAIGLLVASSVYFGRVHPQHVSADSAATFNPVLYAADHLIPVVRFGQSDAWQYHGVPAVVTVVLTVLGWTLGIAIAAAAARTFNRN